MRMCIETPNKEAWDNAQLACFKHGWDWEGEEWPEWKSDPEFALNHDGWHPDVTHLCIIDGNLFTSYLGDGDPVEDGFTLKTIEFLDGEAGK